MIKTGQGTKDDKEQKLPTEELQKIAQATKLECDKEDKKPPKE